MKKDTMMHLLKSNLELLHRALPSFTMSLEKCRRIDLSDGVSFNEEEAFDALTSKFSRISDIFTQKVLKSLTLLLREDAPTFIDRMNLCEKLGILPSAEDMISIRDLRNLIAHEYITENILEIYRETLGLSAKLLEAISQADRSIENLKTEG
ncbi:MAG: hypothetical protein ACOYM3_08895 [Terrimicrobiaceae bacterium]